MEALFVELPAFARYRSDYLDDLIPAQRHSLKQMLDLEIEARR